MSDDLTSEIVKQGLEPIGDIVKRIAGPLADEIGEYFAAVVQPYRIVRQAQAIRKAQQMLREVGISPQTVPPRLLLPILEGAAIEDNEDLHSRWAALLANAAASSLSVHPSYIEILKQLAPDDAVLLEKLYDHCKETRTSVVKPWIKPITYAERERRAAAGENPEVAFDNLIRIGLIQVAYEIDGKKIKVKVPIPSRKVSGVEAEVSGELDEWHVLTDIAKAFVQACRPPKTINAEKSDIA
jgi:hypothetical protein